MSTLGLIFIYLKSFVLGLRRKDAFRLPEPVEGYKLCFVGRQHPLFVGIYQNDAGKKVVVKCWRGSYRDARYYFIMHEIRMYTLFAKVLARSDLPESIKEVRIPRLLYSCVEQESVMMVQEYVDGTFSRFLSDERCRISTYHKAVEFMHFIGAHLTPEERCDIPVCSIGTFMITFPLIVAHALSRHPKRAKQIWRAALGFLFALPALIKNAQIMSLAHKDLHLGNIILNEDGIYVTDLDKCAFTNPMYEYVVTVLAEWRDAEFRDA